MKWFFRWMYQGLKDVEAQDRDEREEAAYTSPLIARTNRTFSNLKVGVAKGSSNENQIHLSQSAMNFRLYPATGGHIVEYSYYDEKKDQNTQALHLIPSDQDLGDSISKIMTLEALKR